MNWHTGPMKDVRHNGESTETKQQEATMTSNERMSVTRREAVKSAAVGAVAAGLGAFASREAAAQEGFDAIVIGTGFGGTVATVALSAHGKKTLVIERGTSSRWVRHRPHL